MEHIHFVIVLEIEPWKVENLSEELADLLEVLGAKVLLHAHHDWLQELRRVPDGHSGQMGLVF